MGTKTSGTTTVLTLHKHRGAYAFEGSPASLRTGVSMRCAALRIADRGYDVDVTDCHRLGVVTRAGQRPVAWLHPHGSQVPGPGETPHWRLGRSGGVLTRGSCRIAVRQAGWPGAPVRVEITGVWAELDLVVLTACFALMTRRRKRTLTIMAIVGAIGHAGPS